MGHSVSPRYEEARHNALGDFEVQTSEPCLNVEVGGVEWVAHGLSEGNASVSSLCLYLWPFSWSPIHSLPANKCLWGMFYAPS